MKKLLVSVIVLAMVLSLAIMPAAAIPEGCTAIDITNDVKFASTVQMYQNGLPIIRDDAFFVESLEYTSDSVGTESNGVRIITIQDFDASLYKDQLAFDVHYAEDGVFGYSCLWAANASDGSTSKLVYEVDIPADGVYEFVFVGAAQIKESNVGNDAKDRGFCYSVDGGQKYQVNISDTPMTFSGDYPYNYTTEQANQAIADGSKTYYQIGYAYGIQEQLSAGKHTIEYYHLEYSGETVVNTGNSSRLNFAGFYVQKYLDPIAAGNYKYPVAQEQTTAEQTTEAPAPDTTKAPEVETPDTTKAPEGEAPEATQAPAPDTTEAKKEGGCGGMISIAALVVSMAAAFVIIKRK